MSHDMTTDMNIHACMYIYIKYTHAHITYMNGSMDKYTLHAKHRHRYTHKSCTYSVAERTHQGKKEASNNDDNAAGADNEGPGWIS